MRIHYLILWCWPAECVPGIWPFIKHGIYQQYTSAGSVRSRLVGEDTMLLWKRARIRHAVCTACGVRVSMSKTAYAEPYVRLPALQLPFFQSGSQQFRKFERRAGAERRAWQTNGPVNTMVLVARVCPAFLQAMGWIVSTGPVCHR